MLRSIPSATQVVGAEDGAPGMLRSIPSASHSFGAEDGAPPARRGLLVVAGEVSKDLYGARLLGELETLDPRLLDDILAASRLRVERLRPGSRWAWWERR
jgi:hypothetical protein